MTEARREDQVTLACLLGLLNSRFISGSYERRANRLFGDKFPKVSKIDLASIPIPPMSPIQMDKIGAVAGSLQSQWQGLRDAFRAASDDLASVEDGVSLADFGEFWKLSEVEFRSRAVSIYSRLTVTQSDIIREAYRKAKTAADSRWHLIASGESDLEELVRLVYGAPEDVYRKVIGITPAPCMEWALRS